MLWGIVTAVEEAARDAAVWVIAVTGSGDALCSGLDLGGPGPEASLSLQGQLLGDVSWVGRVPLAFRHLCDKPVIAGLKGAAERFELANIRPPFASQDAQEARRALFERRSPVLQ
jgi:2-(1,2-epoxy-1,2-dihydrophenyl)acetyl-CoA isomerase